MPAARAQEHEVTKATCRDAYEASQLHRQNSELLAARAELRVCASQACPSVAQSDCVQWLGEVERAVPSVVLEATTDAGNVFDVTAALDGLVIARQFDGRPIDLDPGLHTFAFERPGYPTLRQKVIIRAGEKSRLIAMNWTAPGPARGGFESAPMERPVPVLVYLLAGLGVLGIADFALWAILGDNKRRQLESTCAPFCSNEDVNSVKMRYLAGDIGIGVGVVALAGGAALFLGRQGRVRSGAGFVAASALSGAVFGWRGGF